MNMFLSGEALIEWVNTAEPADERLPRNSFIIFFSICRYKYPGEKKKAALAQKNAMDGAALPQMTVLCFLQFFNCNV